MPIKSVVRPFNLAMLIPAADNSLMESILAFCGPIVAIIRLLVFVVFIKKDLNPFQGFNDSWSNQIGINAGFL